MISTRLSNSSGSFNDQDSEEKAPRFGTPDTISNVELTINKIFNLSPEKHIVLLHSSESAGLVQDEYSSVPLLGRPGNCLTINTPWNNPKKSQRRFFKNGEANHIATSFKTLYLENFVVKAISFTDPMGNPMKGGRVILDKNSKVLDHENTNAKIIQLKERVIRKKNKS